MSGAELGLRIPTDSDVRRKIGLARIMVDVGGDRDTPAMALDLLNLRKTGDSMAGLIDFLLKKVPRGGITKELRADIQAAQKAWRKYRKTTKDEEPRPTPKKGKK